MSFRNTYGIYQAIEQALKASSTPLSCVELLDIEDVKRFGFDANRISDYLGHMFRRGLLGRTAAPQTPNDMSRYAYFWKDTKKVAPAARSVQPRLVVAEEAKYWEANKPTFAVTETKDAVTVELERFILTITKK